MKHDLIIKNGNIIDGTGSDAYSGDISIKNGVITEIGEISGNAAEVIDAEGMTVSPGFVETDMLHTVPPDLLAGIKEEIPLGRFGYADEIALAVLYLCSPAAPTRFAHRSTIELGYLAS